MAKYKLLVLLVLLSFVAKAQVYTPMTAWGYAMKRVKADSTLHIPSFCGVPTLRSSTAKDGAIAMDTCNNKLYKWTNAIGWSGITGGDGGGNLQSVLDNGNISYNKDINLYGRSSGNEVYISAMDNYWMPFISLVDSLGGGIYQYTYPKATIEFIHKNMSQKLKSQDSTRSTIYLPTQNNDATDTLAKLSDVRSAYIDTSSMLSPYLRKVDTTSMLVPYLRKIDSSRWVSSITRTPGKDSIIFFKNGDRFAIKDSVGTNPPASGYYGAFSDNTSQTAASINTAYAVKLNTTDLTNGVSVVNDGSGNPTKIRLANTGIYNIQFSLQLEKTNSSGNMIADIWLRKNSVDIPSTTGKVVLTGSANASPIIAAWNYVLDLAAGDSIQLMWATSNTNVEIIAASATSPHPSTPSVILTVTQQSGIMAGTGITAINSLTSAAQTMVVDSSNTTFKITSTGTSHTFTIPNASSSGVTRGLISNTQYTTFNNKIGTGDTSTMLSPYLRKVDTTAILSPYLRKVDTTAMLSPYLRKVDTTAMLSPYLRKVDTTAFQRKSLASYTFQANKTNATANATANTFIDTSGTYVIGTTGAVTWNATAPTSLANATFKYTQIGKMCTISFSLLYTNAGTSTGVEIQLPSFCATPDQPGFTSTNDFLYSGAGMMSNTLGGKTTSSAQPNGTRACFLKKSASGTSMHVIHSTGVSTTFAQGTVTYFTN